MLNPDPSPAVGHVRGGVDARCRVLAPAPPVDFLPRDRLSAQLTAGVGDRLTVVSGGPGWGKTLAVASWAAARGAAGEAVAWLSVDESDNDPWTFLSDLSAAVIAGGGVQPGNLSLDVDRAGRFEVADVEVLCAQLADLPAPLILVVDDFQVITNGAVLGMFGDLIARLPLLPLRLVVLDQADPVLPLHLLRVGGHLTEIRAADLAFTVGEIGELFALNGVGLRGDQVDLLRDRTGGWPAGVRVAAMSIDPDNIDAGIARCRPNELGATDFFLDAVLRAIPPADLDFMVKTSGADFLTGALADSLTGRSGGRLVLERLARRNFFTVECGVHGWFSYQPMLRELLRHLPDETRTKTQDRALPIALMQPPDPATEGSMTVPSESEVGAVESLIARLTDRFSDVPADLVRQIVNASWDEFTGTPIRSFVPILVERNARERLRHGAAGHPGSVRP